MTRITAPADENRPPAERRQKFLADPIADLATATATGPTGCRLREYPPLDRAAGLPSTVTAGHTTGRVAGDHGGRHGHARSGAWPSKLPGGLPPELAITMGRATGPTGPTGPTSPTSPS